MPKYDVNLTQKLQQVGNDDMAKHRKAIDLIELELINLTNLVDYYSRLREKWPNVSQPIADTEQAIAELQHTREVLVLIS